MKITYKPEVVVCRGCGKRIKASTLEKRTSVVEGMEAVKRWEKNSPKLNSIVADVKRKKIDIYRLYFEIAKINYEEMKYDARNSFTEKLSDYCPSCGTRISADLDVESPNSRPNFEDPSLITIDELRGLPMPKDKIITRLLRSGEVWLPETVYFELARVRRDIERQKATDDDKREYNMKMEELERAPPYARQYVDFITEPAPPELESFTKRTIAELEKLNMRSEFKNEFREFINEFREYVLKTHKENFVRFLTAVQRLAQSDAAKLHYP